MPWVWVAAVLLVWIVAALAVIALCVAVRKTDARLGRSRSGVAYAKQSRPGARAKVE